METPYDKDGTYLGRLADVFGDPTRRAVYRHLREADEPLSASEVGDVFGLHRTVARSHLEKLKELGLAESGTRRRAGGGRPAKTYRIAAARLEVTVPARRYERLSRLLLQVIDDTVDVVRAQEAAFAHGRAYGVGLARDLGGGGGERPEPHLAPAEVVAWLDAAGYNVVLDDHDPSTVAVEVRNCVYSELAKEYPHLVCFLDRGMLCGMLGVDRAAHSQPKALALGDDYCRHEFRV